VSAGWTILCVDDTRDIRTLVQAILERDGALVRVASDGEEGLASASARPPDAILLDVRLPGIDGIETLRRMRAQPSLSRLPIVVMTARGDPATVAAALAAGADDVIEKPFAPDELRARLSLVAGRGPAEPLFGSASGLGWLWPESRDEARDRLNILEEEMAAAMTAGELSEHGQGRAVAEAHRLAGSLGMFGLADGSGLAREIEALLRGDTPLVEAPRVADLVRRLRAEVDAPRGRSDGGEPTAPATRPGVLVVADDPLLLGIVRGLLEPRGLRVATLCDPSLLVARLEGERPDLMLLDAEMSGIDGVELCRSVRGHQRWREVPVLVLTEHTDAATIARLRDAGVDDWVERSIPRPALVERITSALRVSRGSHGRSAIRWRAVTPERDDGSSP
jgi:DNA-binding response OmpR family regulator